MVDMEVPSAYVEFLQAHAAGAAQAELYTMLGLQKQGKTLFFRDLLHHLNHSTDQFVDGARASRGHGHGGLHAAVVSRTSSR